MFFKSAVIFFGLICNCLNCNYHCDDHILILKKKVLAVHICTPQRRSRVFTLPCIYSKITIKIEESVAQCAQCIVGVFFGVRIRRSASITPCSVEL